MRLPNEPVRNTCPDINRLQKTIKEIRDNFASFKEEDNIEDFLDALTTPIAKSKWDSEYTLRLVPCV